MSNKEYKTAEIAKYFSNNRISWNQFYKSEQEIISKLGLNSSSDTLDIGCGCGGLGLAIKEKFGVIKYTGVEINKQAASIAEQMNPNATFYSGDILDISKGKLTEKKFDVVFSLSCVDWNVEFNKSFNSAWEHVKEGGYLVVTLRLTDMIGVNDIEKSFQYINYGGKMEGEIASYVVINMTELWDILKEMNPSEVIAYGYWGKPSSTAVTNFNEICFAAFAIKKGKNDEIHEIDAKLNLPKEIISYFKNS